MTASPGMGQAKTMIKAHENIKTLMANLDVITAPVQVCVETGDLLGFQHKPQDGGSLGVDYCFLSNFVCSMYSRNDFEVLCILGY